MWFIPIVFLTEYDGIRAFSCSGVHEKKRSSMHCNDVRSTGITRAFHPIGKVNDATSMDSGAKLG